MMSGCGKCQKVCAVLVLALGVAFLGVDLGWWNFWNVSWWSAVFLLMGLGGVAKMTCAACQSMCKRR
ncbi:MAG TPA: hypothetical protein VJH22_01145 [Candidatus Nanoarchaeia archaeon]|nr:hypothetical protein [Candidatus Nanoarchaeia archaeon]